MPEQFPDIVPYQKIYGFLHTAPVKRSRHNDEEEFWTGVTKRARHSTVAMSNCPSQVHYIIKRTKQAQTVRMDIDEGPFKSDKRLSTIFNNIVNSTENKKVFE